MEIIIRLDPKTGQMNISRSEPDPFKCVGVLEVAKQVILTTPAQQGPKLALPNGHIPRNRLTET